MRNSENTSLKRKLDESDFPEILRLYELGWGIDRIGIHLKIKHSPILRFIKAQGIWRNKAQAVAVRDHTYKRTYEKK